MTDSFATAQEKQSIWTVIFPCRGKTDNLYRGSLVICCTWRIGLKYGNVLKYEKLKNTPDLSLGNLMAANLKMGHPNPGMRLFTIAFKVAVCFYCIMVVEYIFL